MILRRAAAVGALSMAFVVVAAAPAFAHAQLESTDPQAGSVFDDPPQNVTLTYTEPVEASLGAVRVFDGDGDRIDAGQPEHPDGDGSRVRVDLPDLGGGSYVVTWRVLSADGHPVQGAFTFQVGPEATTDDPDALAARLLASQGGSESLGAAFAVTRAGVFASIALLVGGVAFLVLVWPGGRTSVRAAKLVWAGLIGAAVATAAGLLLQGPYAAGLGLGDALDPDLLGETLDTRFGRVWLARLMLLGVGALLVRRLLPGRRPVAEYPLTPAWRAAALATGAAIVVTPGVAGHAGSGDLVPLAVIADTVHVGAVAVWLGGLVLLVAALLPVADAAVLRSAVPRYSQLALAAVVTIVVTGTFQSWRQVGALANLRDTDFGRVLVVKLMVVAALVVVAAFSREVVNRRFRAKTAERYRERVLAVAGGGSAGGPGGGDIELPELDDDEADAFEVRNLRRSVAIEVVLAAVILSVTAVLVNTEPGRTAESEPVFEVLEGDGISVELQVTPADTGPNDVHVTALTPEGAAMDVLEMEVELTLPERDIAPIAVPLRRLGPGHYASFDFSIPISGEWTLTADALVTDTEQRTATGEISIG